MDETDANRIHEKYAYLYDEKQTKNKLVTDKYNLAKKENQIDDEVYSTELSDMDLDITYKRYKNMQKMNKASMDDIQDEAN